MYLVSLGEGGPYPKIVEPLREHTSRREIALYAWTRVIDGIVCPRRFRFVLKRLAPISADSIETTLNLIQYKSLRRPSDKARNRLKNEF